MKLAPSCSSHSVSSAYSVVIADKMTTEYTENTDWPRNTKRNGGTEKAPTTNRVGAFT